jgi:hypothetical protein
MGALKNAHIKNHWLTEVALSVFWEHRMYVSRGIQTRGRARCSSLWCRKWSALWNYKCAPLEMTCSPPSIQEVSFSFAEYHLICSTKNLVKGPTGASLLIVSTVDLVKSEPLPSVTLWALGTGSVTITWRRDDDFSLSSTLQYSVKVDKKYSTKKSLPMYNLPSVTLGKAFVECFPDTQQSSYFR